ncbi:Pyruvate/Phosphoenolpyruvate kinase-like domain-containing protein [Zopfochytrium polystomum]|nr:Pyruvate/Phosphoenolpyruvate kinase-like domain-containing protein [Zopfochytrium polystomum]
MFFHTTVARGLGFARFSTHSAPRRALSHHPTQLSDDNSKAPRVRRAILYVPGSDERKIASSLKAQVDSRILDLEDSVRLEKKALARETVVKALATLPPDQGERAVRMNAVGSGLEHDDLAAILCSPHLDAILIPKVQSPDDVAFVSRAIDARGSGKGSVKIMASIESARGLLNVAAIAACDPRVEALVFAAEDYVADVGLRRTPGRLEMLYARQAVVTAAKANALQAIDLVCVDYKKTDVLREECTEGRDFGFTGKQAIHPAQVPVIHELFSPSPAEVEYATKIVEGYASYQVEGKGAFNLDGKMIDMPVVKWAHTILAQARLTK